MFWWSRDRTLHWLARHQLTPTADGVWSRDDSVASLTSNDVAHELMEVALEDPSLSPEDRLNLGFGLLDLLDDYGAAMYLAWEFTGVEAAHRDELDLVWGYCREVLERAEESRAVPYWLWVDWFEGAMTSRGAFAQVADGWNQISSVRVERRLSRVLRISGPVPWDAKEPVYRAALGRAELHSAVLAGLSGSFHDVYGQIDVPQAMEILELLELPRDLKSKASSLARALGARI